jgi:endonuclease/exonuclease/phosphatase family metal-dependent hydrolase
MISRVQPLQSQLLWPTMIRPLLATIFLIAASGLATADETLRVMSYNIWLGGTANGQPLSRTVGVIQAAQADVIGIQEQGPNGPAIAAALGFNYHNLGGSTAIISRYPIVQSLTSGARLQLSPTMDAYLFNVHLDPYPYQPYEFRSGAITTEAQAIQQAQELRGEDVTSLLNSMSNPLATGIPVFLVGDFNEPSHLDWTQEAADAGLHFGKKVAWPASTRVTNAGLTDAFRELRPDEINDPGNTWTPGYPPPSFPANEVHDRIDFVYYAGANVTPTSIQNIGYNISDGSTDIAIQPYPSDHRAVIAEFDMPSCFAAGDLNGSCAIDVADWQQFRTYQHSDFTDLTPGQKFERGDLNGDSQNNHADFVLFKAAYEAEHGAGSFANMMTNVPEPHTTLLLMSGLLLPVLIRRRWHGRSN